MSSLLRFLWPAGRMRWLAVTIYAAAVAAIVIGIVLLILVRELSRSGEATAEFVPSSALVYSSINLRPGLAQINRAMEVDGLLRTDDFNERLEDDILEEIEDETGIHPLDDITPWLGTDITFVLLDLDDDSVEWILLTQVADQDEAFDFAEELREYLEDELYMEFDEDEIGDADVWIADDEDLIIGLTEDYLMLADSENTLEDMLDNIDSPPSRPLAEDEQFIAAREALPEGRVMFVYAHIEDSLEEIEDIVGPFGDGDSVWNWASNNTPEFVAASLSFIDKGMRFDVVSEAASRSLSLDSERNLRSAESVPDDTLFLLSYAGVTEAWEELREALEESDPWAAEDFDRFMDDLEDETGVDLQRDVIDSLTGEVSLAIMPGDVKVPADETGLGVIESLLLDALVLASLEDPRDIEDALESLTEWIEDQGYDTNSDSIGSYDAVTLPMDQFDEDGPEDFEPGYLITGDWLALGSSLESLNQSQGEMRRGIG